MLSFHPYTEATALKKKSFNKFLAALPAIIMMAVIFMFSSKEQVQSTNQSMEISYYLADAEAFLSGKSLSPEEREEKARAMDGRVRKAAHMTEFAALSFSVWFALYFWTNSLKLLYFSTVIFCIFYAASDEFHQLFVKGRSGKPEDVLIDSVGILAASFIALAVTKKHGNNEENSNAAREK